MHPPVSLPPLRQLSRTPPTPSDRRHIDPRHGDPLRSILNPQAELAEQQRDRRRSASQMDSPSPVDTLNSNSVPSISRPNSVDSTHDDHQQRSFQPPGRPLGRHLLSPKSPGLLRTPGVNVLNPPTGTIDAHQSPFLTASTRPSDLSVSQSALPTPPAGNRITYFTAGGAIPTPPPNSGRSEPRRASGSYALSGSASPNTQYSPYSQPASVESAQFENHSAALHLPINHSNGHMHDPRPQRGSVEPDRNMIAVAGNSQSSIQFMTIKSQQGHPVQIPVDVQAASKVADEKRRRNAGASARFRARRKEKEREASISISRLEQQLRDAIEDAEYYRSERDYFKAIVCQQPHPERHYARPPSPRLRRLSAPSQAPSTRGGSAESYLDYDDEPREDERNVRRRTSSYHPVSGPPPTELSSIPPVPHSFSGGYPHAHAASVQNPPHVTQLGPRDQSSTAALQRPHPERPVYRDPFAQEHGRYEATTWASSQDSARES